MPAQRPRAAFEPIAPDFDINALVENTPNFSYVDRISCDQIDEQGIHAFEQLVLLHVIVGGKPLVIDGFENRLDPWTFSPKWLDDNVGSKVEHSRNLASKDSLPLTIGHYLKNMRKLSNQYFENAKNYKDKTRQRIYLKDIDCPQVWHDKLQDHIPAPLFYLNESTGDIGGPGSTQDGSAAGRRQGRGLARAGDLMSSLPPEMRAENLMCYIGHEGTYTPAHREMCATMGHNIMVEASKDIGEDGKPEKPGSSIWFMTESKDRNLVSEYWLSVLGHDIEVENHFAQVSAWKRAPFNVYVVEQRPGDFILIPPLAPHQVWNRGTRTMKVAWNRTTVETLEMAMQEALPKARIVCRDEQYKNKAIVYYTLTKYAARLSSAKYQSEKLPVEAARSLMGSRKIKQMLKDFKRLLFLFKDILLSEMFSLDGPQEKCELLPFDSNVTCAYCRGNVFNRFLTCPNCTDMLGHNEEEPYDVCMDCYAMGRSCGCISNLKWMEQFKWKELTQKYDSWRKQAIALDGGVSSKIPPPLIDARASLPHKTLAEVCKEQLKRRPYVDVAKPKQRSDDEESEEDIVVDDEGRVKKTVKKKSKTWYKTHSPCHVCCKRHPHWKSAKCTKCDKWWCYGSLFRGYDTMPLTIMSDPDWTCPHCTGVCFAGACRKDPKQTPYEPKGTLLGHDTKKVADARSVECLVDFSVSNLTWLRDDDEDVQESNRIRRAREEAHKAKQIDPYMDEDEEHDMEESHVRFDYSPDDSLIDPQLMGNGFQTGNDDSAIAQSLSRLTKSLPPPAAMLQGARPAQVSSPLLGNGNGHLSANHIPDGYAPATTSGFLAPQAPMYQEDSYVYPDPSGPAYADEEDGTLSSLQGGARNASKRIRQIQEDDDINMEAHPKRRRISEDPSLLLNRPRNEATKQFEKEKERKALDEAKKQGRFIAAQAALRGKSRLIKLPIPGPRLAQLLAQQAARAFRPVSNTPEVEQEMPEENVLLRSDIAPAKEKAGKTAQNPNKKKIRVERDDDFSVRGDRHQRAEAKRKRPAALNYEEVDLGSEDGEFESDVEGHAPKNGRQDRTGGKRRISSYIQKKHLDDPDLPTELPDNFKDSKRRLEGKTPMPRPGPQERARLSAAKTPSVSFKEIPQLDGHDDEVDEDASYADLLTTLEEENRLAKLEALRMVEEEAFSPPPSAVAPSRTAPSQLNKSMARSNGSSHRSIFDKGRGGKIKIVSRSSTSGRK